VSELLLRNPVLGHNGEYNNGRATGAFLRRAWRGNHMGCAAVRERERERERGPWER